MDIRRYECFYFGDVGRAAGIEAQKPGKDWRKALDGWMTAVRGLLGFLTARWGKAGHSKTSGQEWALYDASLIMTD